MSENKISKSEQNKGVITTSFTRNYDNSIDFEIGKDLVDITINFKNIEEIHNTILIGLQSLYNEQGKIIKIEKI